MNRNIYFICFYFCFHLAGCSLENDYTFNFPPHESVLVVESYLIPGKPYVVLLTETISYGDTTVTTPKIQNANVKIIYGSDSILLYETTEGIYKSIETVPYDYNNAFFLYAEDLKGRSVKGTTKIARPANIDSVKFIFNDKNKAAASVYFTDSSAVENYYRISLLYIDDDIFTDKDFNGTYKPYISDYKMQEDQKVTILLLNLNE